MRGFSLTAPSRRGIVAPTFTPGGSVSRRVSLPGPVSVAAVLASFLLPSTGAAQAKTEIVPFFASYYALSPYGTKIDEFGTGELFSERMSNAPTIGGRISIAITRAIAIEGQAAYNGSGRQATSDTGVFGFNLKGHEFMASGRFTYNPRRSNFRLIGGVGFLSRGGDAWNEANFPNFTGKFDKSIIGGVVGFGARANLTPHLSLDLDVEAFLFSSDADQGDTTFKSKFQQDILVAIGIPIKLGR